MKLNNKLITITIYLTLIIILFVISLHNANAVYNSLPYVFQATAQKQADLKQDNAFLVNLYSGSASYTYNIQVPQGTNQLQPQLTILYNSHKTKQSPSKLGTAWKISQSYIQRDANNTFKTTNDDKFNLVLDGSEYNLVYSPSDKRYHTKIESFLSIQNMTNGNNSLGKYWIVRTKDGTSYRFGYNRNSEAISSLYNYTWRWNLDLVNDTHSNKIFYSYKENPYTADIGASYLDKIEYNNDRKRVIEFRYETSNRSDLRLIYENGNKMQESRRLKQIVITANDKFLRKYWINYTNMNFTSLISSIILFGSDNSTMPATFFNYYKINPGWVRASEYNPPACFSQDGSGTEQGYRLLDVNSDGKPDILYSKAGSRQAWVNVKNGSGWVSASSNWNAPRDFAGNLGDDQGIRFTDVNDDGRMDILYGYGGTSSTSCTIERGTWLNNNGSGWVRDDSYLSPVCFTDFFNLDNGYVLVDFTGDGLTDILTGKNDVGGCTTSRRDAWINDGHGWTQDDSWEPPECFVDDNGFDQGYRLVDVNGDGLVDIISGKRTGAPNFDCTTNERKAWLNNGSGWTRNDRYAPPVCFNENDGLSRNYMITDVNGDGLDDILQGRQEGTECIDLAKTVWLNNGSGWTIDDSFEPPICFGRNIAGDPSWSYNNGTRLADVNGDGMADILQSYTFTSCNSNERKSWFSNSSKALLLKEVKTSLGGSIKINYKPSTNQNNSAVDKQNVPNFNLWIVANITEDNDITGSQNTKKLIIYNYSKGRYDYKDKEFRGFGQVNETISKEIIIAHYFHQDDAKQGREFKTAYFNFSNTAISKSKPFQIEKMLWANTTQNGNSTLYRYYTTLLLKTSEETYDGSINNPRIKNTTYSYDNFSNVLHKRDVGDAKKTGDERYERYEYAYNTNKWIVDKPKRYALLDSDNTTKIRETLFFYDRVACGSSPTKGDLTKKEDWLKTGNNITTKYFYDSYGNIITETNPRNQNTTFIFGIKDATFTYPNRIVNAKGNIFNYNYDLGTSNLLNESDGNNIVTSYKYDVFGRISKEIRPFDSNNLPTKIYEYKFNGTAPNRIKVSKREKSLQAGTLDAYTFYDGFGKPIQSKVEGEVYLLVKDIYYDNLSRVRKESNPYPINFNDNYTSPATAISGISYNYDILDRVVKMTNPDSTSKNIAFDHWNITVLDENNNKKAYKLDAYARISIVEEHYNNSHVYKTSYAYDVADNIVNITDSKGNVFKYNYDTIGRKTSINDPDLRIWNYSYDAASNIIKQVDGRSISVNISYDSLNRITTKNSSDEKIRYKYDTKLNGTLSRVILAKSNISYDYDTRLRKINESTRVDALKLNTNFTYDAMDRVTSSGLADRTIINYTYNNQGLLDSIPGFISNIDYNQRNLPKGRVYANSLATNFTYDIKNFRLKKIASGSKQNINYIYDNVGNVKNINDTINLRKETMIYDSFDRLTSSLRTDNSIKKYYHNFTYNSIGNVLNITKDADEDWLFFYNGSRPMHMPYRVALR